MNTVLLDYVSTNEETKKTFFIQGAVRRSPLKFDPSDPVQVETFLLGLRTVIDRDKWRQVIVGYWAHGLSANVLAAKMGLRRIQIKETIKRIRLKDRNGSKRFLKGVRPKNKQAYVPTGRPVGRPRKLPNVVDQASVLQTISTPVLVAGIWSRIKEKILG